MTPMWLDLIVAGADLQHIVDQLAPATVPLGERGELVVDAPADVTLVAGRGLQIRCRAKLLWPVLGIDVSITIRSVTLLLVPTIESRNGDQMIVFAPEVDAVDLALLPDIGDAELRAFINRELLDKRIELPWNYKETLAHQFALPPWLSSNAALAVKPKGAAVKVTNDSIGLAIDFDASIDRRATPIDDGSSDDLPRSIVPGPPIDVTTDAASHRRRGQLLRLGLGVMGGFSLGCIAALWRK